MAHARARGPLALPPLLLMLWLGTTLVPAARAVSAANSGAAMTCSQVPSDSAGSDKEACHRCLLNTHGNARVLTAAHVEFNWNKSLQAAGAEETVPWSACKLWAEYRAISRISLETFVRAPCLRRVFLEGNAIRELHPDTFSRNQMLLQLGLQRNNILLPPNRPFLNSLSLRILNLSECNISTLYETTFKALPNVSILLLHANKINVLSDEVFSSLNRLELLDVSENLITNIDFASKLRMTCLYAVRNPLQDILSALRKFRLNVTIGLSVELCCCIPNHCGDDSPFHSARQWIAKCEHCTDTLVVSTSFTTVSSELSTKLLNETASRSTEYESPKLASHEARSVSLDGLENKKQTQIANVTVILLSTIFSFLILVQSSIIVFLLIKSKRNVTHVTPSVYFTLPNSGVVVPSLIYGVKEKVTDLDEESCSHLSLNPVYETIPE